MNKDFTDELFFFNGMHNPKLSQQRDVILLREKVVQLNLCVVIKGDYTQLNLLRLL